MNLKSISLALLFVLPIRSSTPTGCFGSLKEYLKNPGKSKKRSYSPRLKNKDSTDETSDKTGLLSDVSLETIVEVDLNNNYLSEDESEETEKKK